MNLFFTKFDFCTCQKVAKSHMTGFSFSQQIRNEANTGLTRKRTILLDIGHTIYIGQCSILSVCTTSLQTYVSLQT